MSNATSASTIVAYFATESAAEKAVRQLLDTGFTSSEIGIASRSNHQTSTETDSHSKAASGESTWDKVKGFFSGTDSPVEPYADESTKGDVASHEITAGDSDYSHEDVSHSLSGFSLPEEQSRYFGHRFGAGDQGSVVTVTAAGREEDAEAILIENGGDLGANASDYDYAESDSAPVSGQQRIQLLGEVLRVHKDRISAGEVRVRKDVITETQTIEVPVTREELVIERFAGSSTAPVKGRVGEGSDIRIPLTEEVASAEKHTFVREEVAIGKRAVEGVRSIGDTVSHEELVVEDSTKRSA
jgi:uncharacterized protein (TIGR02271 family)